MPLFLIRFTFYIFYFLFIIHLIVVNNSISMGKWKRLSANITSAEFLFYLALYVSVGQEPKHIMARWHFCNYNQVLGLGSPNTRSQRGV